MKWTREHGLAGGMLGALAWLAVSSPGWGQVISVTVNRSSYTGISQFAPAISQIDNSLNFPYKQNNGAAVTNARSLVAEGVHWMNSFSMAWGVSDPWPDPLQPNPSLWSALDSNVKRAVDLGAVPVISLCEAPWWMKGQQQSDGSTKLIPDISGEWDSVTNSSSMTDYRGLSYPVGYVTPDPYGCRVLDNQMTNWLTLVEAVARRYMVPPYNVRYFQVWNEFKGYHNPGLNRWDYENKPGDPTGYHAKHGYTYMYNQVYSRLKSVATSQGLSAEAIQVGGAYLVMSSGSASNKMSHPSGLKGPWGIVDRRPLDAVAYWLTNKVGAEFVICDGSNRNKFGDQITDPFTRCDKFATVNQWIRQQAGGAALPIWWAEWYSHGDGEGPWPDDFNAALGAYSTIQHIRSGAARTWLWGGEFDTAGSPPLWTSTATNGGGQPTPWYYVYKNLGNYFGQGTPLCAATASSTNLAVLASAQWTMLVNKLATPMTVSLDGMTTNLAAYGVVLLPAPSSGQIPRPPVGLRAQPGSSARIELNWTDTATNESGFEIWRAIGAGSPYTLRAQVGANVTAYSDTGVTLDTVYSYYVRAFNAQGASAPSIVATARTMPFDCYEVEQLPVAAVSSGDPVSVYTDVNLSQGQGSLLDGSGVNDYITYRVAVPRAGTCSVTVRATRHTNRGKFQLAVASSLTGPYTNLGGVQDLYASSQQHVRLGLGLVTFPSAGAYYFQCKVTSKHSSSTDYKLALDFLQLAPYFLQTVRRMAGGPFQATLTGPALTQAVVQTSSNLSSWIPLLTNQPFNGRFSFDDSQAAGTSQRFYRVQLQP